MDFILENVKGIFKLQTNFLAQNVATWKKDIAIKKNAAKKS
jgi:hypothetical protein